MKNNIIFLDVDGVLNGYSVLSTLGWNIACIFNFKEWYRKKTDPSGIHKNKVKILSKIVSKSNAKVVMTSTWRDGYWKTPYNEMTDREKQLVDLLEEYNIEVIDITGHSKDNKRGKEILYWLSHNLDKVNNYVILDDESSTLSYFFYRDKLVKTHRLVKFFNYNFDTCGLRKRNVKEAVKIIMSDYDINQYIKKDMSEKEIDYFYYNYYKHIY